MGFELDDESQFDSVTVGAIAKKRKKRMRVALLYSCNSGQILDIMTAIADMVLGWDKLVGYGDLFGEPEIIVTSPIERPRPWRPPGRPG